MPSYFHKVIEVCDKCLRASCWHGEFMCDEAKNAGTMFKTIGELKKLGFEHEDNWSAKKLKSVYGESAPHGYNQRLNVDGAKDRATS